MDAQYKVDDLRNTFNGDDKTNRPTSQFATPKQKVGTNTTKGSMIKPNNKQIIEIEEEKSMEMDQPPNNSGGTRSQQLQRSNTVF